MGTSLQYFVNEDFSTIRGQGLAYKWCETWDWDKRLLSRDLDGSLYHRYTSVKLSVVAAHGSMDMSGSRGQGVKVLSLAYNWRETLDWDKRLLS